MKKGFTLIELLAVILILGIIALIVIPTVTNIVKESKTGAFSSTLNNLNSAVEKNCSVELLNEKNITDHYIITNGVISPSLDIKGELPNSGEIFVNKECNTLFINVTNNDDYASKDYDTTIEVGKYKTFNTGNKKIVSKVFFNPTTGKKCNSSEATSNTEQKTGCMKWYAIENSGPNKATVDLILDHSTKNLIAWNGANTNTTPREVITQLNNDTSSWLNIENPRLISSDEIAQIVKHPTYKSTESDNAYIFYFDSLNRTDPNLSAGQSEYSWLYDNLRQCRIKGCEIEDANASVGYWTSSYYARDSYNVNVVTVSRLGNISTALAADAFYGVRPVVTIKKDVLN